MGCTVHKTHGYAILVLVYFITHDKTQFREYIYEDHGSFMIIYCQKSNEGKGN